MTFSVPYDLLKNPEEHGGYAFPYTREGTKIHVRWIEEGHVETNGNWRFNVVLTSLSSPWINLFLSILFFGCYFKWNYFINFIFRLFIPGVQKQIFVCVYLVSCDFAEFIYYLWSFFLWILCNFLDAQFCHCK